MGFVERLPLSCCQHVITKGQHITALDLGKWLVLHEHGERVEHLAILDNGCRSSLG